MALFRFHWLRKFIRRHSNPIPENRAERWKGRLSTIYMLLAWNAFGIVVYCVSTGKADWAAKYKSKEELQLTPAQQWTKTLDIKEATVYRISGLKTNRYEINNESKEISDNEQ